MLHNIIIEAQEITSKQVCSYKKTASKHVFSCILPTHILKVHCVYTAGLTSYTVYSTGTLRSRPTVATGNTVSCKGNLYMKALIRIPHLYVY